MMTGAAIAAAFAYLVGLFWLAAWGDARRASGVLKKHAGLIYGLSLGVYCTSWTFFGGVGTAANRGFEFLPILLGPLLVFTFGFKFFSKVLAQAKAQHSTSIADFLSARYGKSAGVAALVTIFAVIGALPYMALQLQSVGASLLILNPTLAARVQSEELVALVAALMGLFAMVFGSGRGEQESPNAGLVLTIAAEAVVKLGALAIVAILAVFALLDPTLQNETQPSEPVFGLEQFNARFFALTFIAACAAFCLPRQFHMSFVEAPGEKTSSAMRWLFPTYLALTAIVIVPIVFAGLALLPTGTSPDTIVIALPLGLGSPWVAMIAFIGGLAASTGMILVATVALSTMITNDLIAPITFRKALSDAARTTSDTEKPPLGKALILTRRMVIATLVLLAYGFYLALNQVPSLADLGILAFAAAAQFAPGLFFGMVSKAGNKSGMLCGLAAGAFLWAILLLLPAILGTSAPLVIHEDPLVSGILLSIGANCLAYWAGSAAYRPSLTDDAQAAAFVGSPAPGSHPRLATKKRVADVRVLLGQFVGRRRADAVITGLGIAYEERDTADATLLEAAERTIAGMVGSSSARMLISSWSIGDPIALPDVVAMFDETNRRLSFSAELLQTAIENIETGVALVDADMRLVAWNNRYQDMFALPDHLVAVGTPIAELIRHNQRTSSLSEDAIEVYVERRLNHMRAGHHHRLESTQKDGRIMRIVGAPTPGGGYVTSYTDITADRQAEQALEQKVAERTHQLSEANKALADAIQSKTRFLAAASHDLIQPLNAARLFASALGEETAGEPRLEKLVEDLDGSIASADRLIRALLDISKLDGQAIEPVIEAIALNDIFAEITAEFAVQADAKKIALNWVPTSAIVRTDRALLTSVLRNLMSNAVRYTDSGGVLLGVRRDGPNILLCVHDTGRGITDDHLGVIFEEFKRGASNDRDGLGLGLAIVRRITALLGVSVQTHSTPSRGSRFALRMPVENWREPSPLIVQEITRNTLTGARVLIVDNEPAALTATSTLLEKWGLETICAADLESARRACKMQPDLVVMDFRLDDGELGDSVYTELCHHWQAMPPVILLTADSGEETEIAAERIEAHRLLKPPSPAALRALITNCLSQSGKARGQPYAQSYKDVAE